MRYIYTVLFYLALPFALIRLWWRGRHVPDNRKRWAERFGFCPFHLDNCIWVHTVSVGETIAAAPLIKSLQKSYQDVPIVVTNMTVTGAARVKAIFGDQVLQTFIPYDVPDAVARFLDRIHPKVAVMMETEIWPNLFAACKQRHIPIVIINARLSEKSAQGYKKAGALTRDMLSAVHGLASQGKTDAERFVELGLANDKIVITGNLKFDLDISPDLIAKGLELRQQLGVERLIWIAASTHPTEEEIILSAHRMILQNHPNALLILVPRHPDRFDTVAQLCEQQGFQWARRSRGDLCHSQTNLYLADTMGELLLLYSAADIAFVAGSFAQIGGHNMLEPAALHKPILTGPILFNFADISKMLIDAKGMMVVNNANELAIQIQRMFNDSALRQTMGENAYQVIAANRGALAKQIELVKKYIH